MQMSMATKGLLQLKRFVPVPLKRRVILFDDANRAGEAEVLRRWTSEAKIEVAMHKQSKGSFAVITRK
jgi:hypothetical protein